MLYHVIVSDQQAFDSLAGKSRDRTDKNHEENCKTGYDFTVMGKRLIYAKITCAGHTGWL